MSKSSQPTNLDQLVEYQKKQVGATLSVLLPGFAFQVEQLQQQIYSAMELQGFWACDNTGEKIALMHSELSEALEADRKNLQSDHIPEFTGVEEELADCIIRILDFAGRHNLRLGQAIQAKSLYNLSRPYMHGKKY
ncbi:ntP-ppase [Bacteriophage sp.]|nr:ntP-ppase [Bacteriophage sp.]